ncbi:MAG: flagellar motor protein [Pseudomonadota bacterium]
MDILAIIGAIIAFSAIILGNALEGGQLSALLNGPAFIIVIGGTLGAVCLQTPFVQLRRAGRLAGWVLKPPVVDPDNEIDQFGKWSKTAHREGVLGLEDIADNLDDAFKRKGLELVIDGAEPHHIRRLLEIDSRARVESDLAAASVFRSLGGYAPTIGILGAVIGLIHVMGNLSNPDELGTGIATAFVATIYGVGFANLLFLPVADRLKAVVRANSVADDLFIEGIVAIAEGEHPRTIGMRMRGMLGTIG